METNICNNCGNNEFENDLISRTFIVKNKLYLIENIPAKVCNRCEEPLLTIETAEKIRLLLNSRKKPIKQIAAEVFEYS